MLTSKQFSSLTLIARPSVVGRYTGELCLSLAVMCVVPALVSAALRDWSMAGPLAVVTLLFGGYGYGAIRLLPAKQMQRNEGLVTISLVFLVASLALSWPLSSGGVPYVDGLFEAVSAVTTTGLSTVPNLAERSPAYLFTRAWVQWYGGFIILVVALALLAEPGSVSRQLSGDLDPDDLAASTRTRARHALIVYCILTFVGFLAIWAMGVDWYDSLLHTLTAVATGGFSPYSTSLAAMASWGAQAMTMLLCLAGAISLSLYFKVWRAGWRKGPALLLGDSRLKTLIIFYIIVALCLTATMSQLSDYSVEAAFEDAPLLAASAQTTAGFSTIEVASLDPASKLIMIIAMAVGGDAVRLRGA